MSFSYDPTLPTNRDHVRLLISDTDSATALFSDEELTSLLADETATGQALKYFAAARCLEILVAKWAGSGRGEIEKQIDTYRVRRGMNENSTESLLAMIKSYKERGAFLLLPSGRRYFRTHPRTPATRVAVE